MINEKSLKPIYLQVKEWIENEILCDNLSVGDRIMSQNEMAVYFNINPMTALKGVSLLEARGVVEKWRGIGMFVTVNAREIIMEYRTQDTLSDIIDELITETIRLNIEDVKLFELLEKRLGQSRRQHGEDDDTSHKSSKKIRK